MPFKNKEDYNKYKREYRLKHRDSINEKKREYAEKNKEVIREKDRIRYRKNRVNILKKAQSKRDSAYYQKRNICYCLYLKQPRQFKRQMFQNIKKRIKHKPSYKNRKLSFTFPEFLSFIDSQPIFSDLYKRWSSAGFPLALAPSLDRIDNSKDYTLDNIQIITQHENTKRKRK